MASYTKADMANHIVIEVPEVMIHTNSGNTTEQPRTDPLPDVEEIIASVDGQKSVRFVLCKHIPMWVMICWQAFWSRVSVLLYARVTNMLCLIAYQEQISKNPFNNNGQALSSIAIYIAMSNIYTGF